MSADSPPYRLVQKLLIKKRKMPHSRLRCLHDKNGTNSHDVPSNFQLLFFAMCRMSSFPWDALERALQNSPSEVILDILRKHELYASEPLDELYDALGDVIGAKEETVCYKSYLLPSGEPVGLEENVAVISEGTTGLVTWEAALHLAEWALEHPDIFTGRTVLELGSGVGLTGIVVCRVCKPTKYVFSDCHQSVLERLRNNITRNGLTEQGSPGVSVLTEEVDWQNVKKDQLRRIGADTIIAADVVYDPDIIGCLVRLLAELLKCKGQQRHPEVYIASTIRNPETYNCFKNELEKAGLKHIVITHPVTQVFPYNRIVSIEMIKVHC
ncbi:protein-lysine N-methyltransferase EEF2KMT isoform X2 [Electrophorus electricus]|uniref:protein-lysine N-methyltransferase EEF2KMT isoform X2 n=1 Tax=Electrophorus electricus TaxID=8005 RepID=UPI0015CF9995|nr:protein-lysine N-methyltransferase EEF2KMT isoform X2 [Electrophorus electricus]